MLAEIIIDARHSVAASHNASDAAATLGRRLGTKYLFHYEPQSEDDLAEGHRQMYISLEALPRLE